MTGNVREWCWDIHGEYLGTSTDPVGPQSGTYRVYRGGSWYNIPSIASLAIRGWKTPDSRHYNFGLRLVRKAS